MADYQQSNRILVNLVTFALTGGRLRVLLNKVPADTPIWTLPGQDLGNKQTPEAIAGDILNQHTDTRDVYLEQLYTFAQTERVADIREISITYYALIPTDIRDINTDISSNACWVPVGVLPRLCYDHAHMIELAHERLAAKLRYSTIAFQLLPGFFTLSELQSVYEIVLDCKQDKRNFRKSNLATTHVEETGEKRRNGVHRPAKLYRPRNPRQVVITR